MRIILATVISICLLFTCCLQMTFALRNSSIPEKSGKEGFPDIKNNWDGLSFLEKRAIRDFWSASGSSMDIKCWEEGALPSVNCEVTEATTTGGRLPGGFDGTAEKLAAVFRIYAGRATPKDFRALEPDHDTKFDPIVYVSIVEHQSKIDLFNEKNDMIIVTGNSERDDYGGGITTALILVTIGSLIAGTPWYKVGYWTREAVEIYCSSWAYYITPGCWIICAWNSVNCNR